MSDNNPSPDHHKSHESHSETSDDETSHMLPLSPCSVPVPTGDLLTPIGLPRYSQHLSTVYVYGRAVRLVSVSQASQTRLIFFRMTCKSLRRWVCGTQDPILPEKCVWP